MVGIFWLALLILLIVIEIITLGLTTIWFAGGALAAFLICIAGGSIPVQGVVFFLVSFLLLFVTRPLAVKFMEKGREKTNIDSLIGKMGIVLEKIDNTLGTGTVLLNGQEWTARSKDDKIIEADKKVLIDDISGVKLIVDDNLILEKRIIEDKVKE